MKYLYNVAVMKSDNTTLQLGILAADTVSPAKSAAENALAYAIAQGGTGSYVQTCFMAGKVDHDATV